MFFRKCKHREVTTVRHLDGGSLAREASILITRCDNCDVVLDAKRDDSGITIDLDRVRAVRQGVRADTRWGS